MSQCPCGAAAALEQCCLPFIKGSKLPESAELLMRSRYTAFTLQEMDYVESTHHVDTLKEFDRSANESWAERAEWAGLEITGTEAGGPEDEEGVVTFKAYFNDSGLRNCHHERSTFKKADDGKWYFVEGRLVKQETVQRVAEKVGRNDPCSCGSGKKYKKCCLKS